MVEQFELDMTRHFTPSSEAGKPFLDAHQCRDEAHSKHNPREYILAGPWSSWDEGLTVL
jgi:hypothetical protein